MKIKYLMLLAAFFLIAFLRVSVFAEEVEETTETTTEITTETTQTSTETASETTTQSLTETTSETTTDIMIESTTQKYPEGVPSVPGDDLETVESSSKEQTETTSETTTEQTSKTTTEQTTSQTTEATTEATTETVTQKHNSSGSGGGGGGGSGGTGGGVFKSNFSQMAKKTTETETEATTSAPSAKTLNKKESGIKFADKTLSYFIDSPLAYLDKTLIFVIYSPYIQKSSNSTLISVRSLQNGLGKDVKITWQAKTKTAVVRYNGHKLEIIAGRKYMLADGKRVNFKYGAYAEIKDGRVYLPFRALGEGLGFEVSWDGKRKRATYLIQKN